MFSKDKQRTLALGNRMLLQCAAPREWTREIAQAVLRGAIRTQNDHMKVGEKTSVATLRRKAGETRSLPNSGEVVVEGADRAGYRGDQVADGLG
jgi:hypothetical protein